MSVVTVIVDKPVNPCDKTTAIIQPSSDITEEESQLNSSASISLNSSKNEGECMNG